MSLPPLEPVRRIDPRRGAAAGALWRPRRPRLGLEEPPPALGPDCAALIAELRARREAARSGPGPGELGDRVRRPEPEIQCLFRAALAHEGVDGNGWFVWQNLDSELAVHVQESRIALRPGLFLAGLRTRCEELGEVEVVVPLAVGTEAEPAGMVIAAEPVARGPDLLVDIWGANAVAAVWQAFVDVCVLLAASAGEDRYCHSLLPGAVYSEHEWLTVVPQALHEIDVAQAEGSR
jgi:hypothetical protein